MNGKQLNPLDSYEKALANNQRSYFVPPTASELLACWYAPPREVPLERYPGTRRLFRELNSMSVRRRNLTWRPPP